MSDGWCAFAQVFDGTRLHRDAAVLIQAGQVAALGDAPAGVPVRQGCLSMGFVDCQVNGGGGVMLNSTPTPDGMRAMAQAHRRYGTVAIMPTVITDAPDVLEAAAQAAIAAVNTEGIIGLHIEGPHIAKAKRGTHAAQHIRPLDAATMAIVAQLRAATVPVMITLAPEAATPDQITALARMGAIVSLGHTNATAQDIDAAIAAGATCGTHLFNAMSQMQGRAAGAVGAILNSDVAFGLICDGHHVSDAMMALALRAAGPDRGFLVSDAMATVGGPDHFTLYDQTIRLVQGRLINQEGNLAGAQLTQAAGLRRMIQRVSVPLDEALRMAITTPARLMGQSQLAQLIGRDPADLVIVSDDLAVTPFVQP